MAHWEHRPETAWKSFAFNQPYAKGLKRLKEEVLAKTDFDPATLWQWGTMQAMALIEVLKEAEGELGEVGQQIVTRALRRTGLDVGRQILANLVVPEGMTDTELMSFYATVINRIAYASLEEPRIDGPDKVTFDIVWCPHQDHYQAFDCRIQRYFVQGMLDAMAEIAPRLGFEVRFDTTIPSGAPTCHFTVWKGTGEEHQEWKEYTKLMDAKALVRARRDKEARATDTDAPDR